VIYFVPVSYSVASPSLSIIDGEGRYMSQVLVNLCITQSSFLSVSCKIISIFRSATSISYQITSEMGGVVIALFNPQTPLKESRGEWMIPDMNSSGC